MFNGLEVSVGMIKAFWKWMVVISTEHWEYTYCHFTVHLKIVKMTNFVLGIFYHNKTFSEKVLPYLVAGKHGGKKIASSTFFAAHSDIQVTFDSYKMSVVMQPASKFSSKEKKSNH